jgi:hypothetical protein
LRRGWRRPEVYLDPAVRAGISSFALGNNAEIETGLTLLRTDLSDGRWQDRYGSLMDLAEIDAGYRFLRLQAA